MELPPDMESWPKPRKAGKLRLLWCRLRYGKVTFRTTDRIDGITCEQEIVGRWGGRVGYWAYGHYEPGWPYNENCQW